jgi:uncharacterized protein (DUF433 family)
VAAVDDQALIDRYLDLSDAEGPTGQPARARVRGHGVHVWAIVDHLRLVEGDIARVAELYRVPREAVLAVEAYYARHKAAIDAYVLIHAA